MELCGGVHTVQRQTPIQIPIGLYTNFIGISVSFGVGQREYTISEIMCLINGKYINIYNVD